MWSFQGKPLKIKSSILGKVTLKKQPLLSRHKYLLITDNPTKFQNWNYAGLLSDETQVGIDSKKTCLLSKSNLAMLKEGDIILMEPGGLVTALWNAGAFDNSILSTERCNCRCIMCPQPPKMDQPGLQDFNLQIISLLDSHNTKSICITGGEPTLLGDDFIKLVKECSNRLPDVPLVVLTNGKNFHDFEFTKRLVNVGNMNLTLCIALYSDNDKDHDKIVGVQGSFYETIKGLTNLALFRQKIEIRNVISALNYERLPQYSEFIYKNFPFTVHIALMGAEMTGNAAVNSKDVWIDPVDYLPQLEYSVKYLRRREMNVSIYNLQHCILPQTLWAFSRKSISGWKRKYHDLCSECDYNSECGGMFATSHNFQSKNIHALRKSLTS
jgi:His-Xaa-Ser system radical SAM maturase HxsC